MTDTITLEEYQRLTRRNKYNNTRVRVDGNWFDSLAEASQYRVLRQRQADGEITRLRIHPVYVLQERFTAPDGTKVRAITYTPDFAYDEAGHDVAIDVKGVETQVYRIKRALFLKRYPNIRFEVVKV